MRRWTPAAATLLLLVPAFTVAADTYVVDGSGAGDFVTIQSAVDHAVTGDTLLIRSGTYLEDVVSTDTFLTWIGEGSGSTILRGVSASPSFHLPNTDPNTPRQIIMDMTVEHSATGDAAVTWCGGHVEFLRCELTGTVGAEGDPYGSGDFRQSSLTDLDMHSYGFTLIEDCDVGSATFTGVYYQAPGGGTACQSHGADSYRSRFASVHVSCAGLDSGDDEVGHLGIGTWSSCRASGSTFGSIGTTKGARLELDGCTVEGNIDLQPVFFVNTNQFWVEMRDCTVLGDFLIDAENQAQDYPFGYLELYHNTFMGDLAHEWLYIDAPIYFMRGNIVAGETMFEFISSYGYVIATHNDFVGGLSHGSAVPDSVYSNIHVDPLMCGPAAGDFTLEDCSPCVGTAHDGGDMGAYGVGCGCTTVVTPMTWGKIKTLYR